MSPLHASPNPMRRRVLVLGQKARGVLGSRFRALSRRRQAAAWPSPTAPPPRTDSTLATAGLTAPEPEAEPAALPSTAALTAVDPTAEAAALATQDPTDAADAAALTLTEVTAAAEPTTATATETEATATAVATLPATEAGADPASADPGMLIVALQQADTVTKTETVTLLPAAAPAAEPETVTETPPEPEPKTETETETETVPESEAPTAARATGAAPPPVTELTAAALAAAPAAEPAADQDASPAPADAEPPAAPESASEPEPEPEPEPESAGKEIPGHPVSGGAGVGRMVDGIWVPAPPAATPRPPVPARIPYREWKGPRPRVVGLGFVAIVLAGIISLTGGIAASRAPVTEPPAYAALLERVGVDAAEFAAAVQGVTLATALVVFGLYLLIAVLIREGRNWARIGASVLAAAALAVTMYADAVLQVLAVLVAIAGLALLYVDKCNKYFRPRRSRYLSSR